MPTQEEAIRKVGEAFGTGPTDDMTAEQRRAFERVQREFTPRSDEDIVEEPKNEFRLGMVDPDDTDARRASQRIADTNTESALASFEAQRQESLRRQQDERERLRTERSDLAQKQADAMEGFSQEDILRKEREELGVPEMLDEQQIAIQEIRGLREQYTNLEQQKGEALALSDGRQAPVGFIRGEKARIAEQFDRRQATVAARMQSETAHMQAMQGMVSQARSLIGDIVQAATFDTELEMKRIQIFRDVNAQEISELDRDIQNQLQESQRYWENRLQTERQEKTQVMEWMVQAPEAGITVNDDLETAAGKVRTYNATTGTGEVEEVMSYEQWKETDQAQRLIEEEQERRQMSLSPEAKDEFLREQYNNAVQSSATGDTSFARADNIVFNQLQQDPFTSEDSLVRSVREQTDLNISDALRVVRDVRQQNTFIDEQFFRDLYGGEEGLKLIAKQDYQRYFSEEEIKDMAERAGFVKGWLWDKPDVDSYLESPDFVNQYLSEMLKEVETQRSYGESDFDIAKELLKE